ncbi:MAG: CBS domain-containing protein [Gammaproteobacteria bacterium]|nr:CBS domain-containing protein [Gammaproteobacteria bacterium]
MTLKDLIEQKNRELVTITPGASVLSAIRLMCEHKVGALLVMSDDGRLAGILTERDILLYCANHGGELESTTIGTIMTKDLITAPPDCSAEEAMTLMTERRFRHLPIIEEGKPTGMISIGDLVKARLKDITVEVKYLRDYISA